MILGGSYEVFNLFQQTFFLLQNKSRYEAFQTDRGFFLDFYIWVI